MNKLSELFDALYFTSSNNAKSVLLREYLANTPDPERGWAIAALAGELQFTHYKRNTVKKLILERVDPVLFALSYDYVGEMSETVAHLWPNKPDPDFVMPTLSEFVAFIQTARKSEIETQLIYLLNNFSPSLRWTLLKLGTGGLRVGLSARRLKQILAEYGQSQQATVTINDIENLWHGLTPPYTDLLLWLENSGPKPDISEKVVFHPVLLAHPLQKEDKEKITYTDYLAEFKYDGIRVQIVVKGTEKALFSRTGDDISHSFPDVLANFNLPGVYDGELLAMREGVIGSFNDLQQRLNKKKPSKKLQTEYPCGLVLYDALFVPEDIVFSTTDEQSNVLLSDPIQSQTNTIIEADNVNKDKSVDVVTNKTVNTISSPNLGQPVINICHLSLIKRKQYLRATMQCCESPNTLFSEDFNVHNTAELDQLRTEACSDPSGYTEGLMLKHKESPYTPGRPKGVWFKYKRNAQLVDAVIMYAQRGHGKRSSFYSDFTFGLWENSPSENINTTQQANELPKLLPIGKAYSGFTDAELKELDKWVRKNTIGRFGPVKEVNKTLVFEVAFDAAHTSKRHKSGVALRFPRIHRIRWDKPAVEADTLPVFKKTHQIK